jgi:hypothetical protein
LNISNPFLYDVFVRCFFFIVSASISCHSQARIDQNRAEALRRKRAKEAWGSGEFVLLAMSLFHSSYNIFFLFFLFMCKQTGPGLGFPFEASACPGLRAQQRQGCIGLFVMPSI